MPATLVEDLSSELKTHFNITKIHAIKNGGQKKVFIVTKDGVKCALKLFQNFGKRDIRELEIYRKFKQVDGIPKIISIENFSKDKIVFEEYIDGSNLNDVLGEYAKNSEKIKDLIIKICLILKPIWEDNKIHRDIKPNNIMIRNNGKPVVIDFGIAQDLAGTVYTTNFIPNSWDFASPEQLLGQRDLIDYRSDFFSIGVIGYVLYYQHKPFGASQEIVREKFAARDTSYTTDANCKLNYFFKECLGFSPADRPRDLPTLLQTLRW
ncbi:MAG: protein kinase [bacterium]|nr:protein kinase [bacterium]